MQDHKNSKCTPVLWIALNGPTGQFLSVSLSLSRYQIIQTFCLLLLFERPSRLWYKPLPFYPLNSPLCLQRIKQNAELDFVSSIIKRFFSQLCIWGNLFPNPTWFPQAVISINCPGNIWLVFIIPKSLWGDKHVTHWTHLSTVVHTRFTANINLTLR